MNENYITGTGLLIHKSNLSINAIYNLRSKLSVLDFMTQTEVPKAYFEFGDYVCIPKIDTKLLNFIAQKELALTPIYQDDYLVKEKYKLTQNPLNHQIDIIDKAYNAFLNKVDKRVCICLQPGYGKTYIAANLISKLNCKFVFIVYSADLLQQNLDNISRVLDCKWMYPLKSSSELMELNFDKIHGLFITQSMLRSCIKTYGLETVLDVFTNKLKATMKIIDEFDRDVSTIYRLDAFGNFRYNLYLSGTNYKSLRPDDSIFQSIYKHSTVLGTDIQIKPNKDLILIHTKFSPYSSEYFSIMRNEKTFKIFYNNHWSNKDITLDYIMERFYHKEDSLMKKLIEERGKIVFYCGRIENCDNVKEKLMRHGIKEDDIGIVNSKITKESERDINKNKPFICSTMSSLGRGYDDKSVRMLVFLELTFSKPDLIQSISRVGRVNGDHGYVIYPVDHSFATVIQNFNARYKAHDSLFRLNFDKIYEMTIPEEMFKDYHFGYNKDSKEAKAINEKEKKRRTKFYKLI